MLYMVIERFHEGAGPEIYKRLSERGRMMPEGMKYLGSWIEPDMSRCFQIMEWDDPDHYTEWTSKWDDLVDFEAIPVISSVDAQSAMRARSSG